MYCSFICKKVKY